MQIMINLPQNFDMTCNITQCVLVPNLKSFRSMETELWAKEGGEVSVTWENGLVGILLPTNMAVAI